MSNDLMTDLELARGIRHAESYPFARPACSYLFRHHAMHPLPRGATGGRAPVIASGSNASPARLAAKFDAGDEIPVTRAVLRDFAVVFAGHFTAYGAIPATLYPHEGATTDVWITWLTDEQLTIMHRSEGVIGGREVQQRYDYVELSGIDLRTETGLSIARAGAYLSRRMLAPAGEPIRFAEVATQTNGLRANSHRSTLRLAARLIEPEEHFHSFMHRVLSGVSVRQTLFQALSPFTIDRDHGWTNQSTTKVEIGIVSF
jgi:hypothetical protein